jgi:hypothetical protein
MSVAFMSFFVLEDLLQYSLQYLLQLSFLVLSKFVHAIFVAAKFLRT